jgi:pimeloyl-ACP methyl ester carboxylesterase
MVSAAADVPLALAGCRTKTSFVNLECVGGFAMRRLIAALTLAGTLFALSLSGNAASAAPAIAWHKCTKSAQLGFECATIRVPLEYEHPQMGDIELALIRHRSSGPGRRIGTLFYEPGGPGVPGTEFLPALAYRGFPAAVRARFDIVSWDPRGVGASTAVHCFASQPAEDQFFSGSPTRNVDGFPVGQSQMNTWIDRYRRFGEICQQRNGRLLTHVSTADTARDLDLMRERAGERMMNFVGTSYGTIVGAVYANMFPARVRAMVLDGVVNPIAWTRPDLEANGGRFLSAGLRFKSDVETAKTLNSFLDLCGSTDTSHCAFSAGNPAATRQKFTKLLARLPVNLTHGQTTYAVAISGAARALYLITNWKLEAIDLQKLWEHGPSAVPPPPGRDEEQELAVGCGEVPSPPTSAFPAIGAFAQRRSGVVGPFWAWDYEPCSTWPVLSANPFRGRWDNRTASPVLVIGNTFDPATPLGGAQVMARALARARLLTVDGYGHTALINPSACVNRYESQYFIDGTLPPKGARCAQDGHPFS